jgi:hypothetical protein
MDLTPFATTPAVRKDGWSLERHVRFLATASTWPGGAGGGAAPS